MPSQFAAAQQREMAMRNAREARFLALIFGCSDDDPDDLYRTGSILHLVHI